MPKGRTKKTPGQDVQIAQVPFQLQQFAVQRLIGFQIGSSVLQAMQGYRMPFRGGLSKNFTPPRCAVVYYEECRSSFGIPQDVQQSRGHLGMGPVIKGQINSAARRIPPKDGFGIDRSQEQAGIFPGQHAGRIWRASQIRISGDRPSRAAKIPGFRWGP